MFKTVKKLPESAEFLSEINLQKNKSEFLIMNILSLVLFVFSFMSLFLIKDSFIIYFEQLFYILIITIVYIILHELVHAIFFKFKNKVKVQFKFHGFAASAGVPGVYYQKWHYLMIALAPFVVLSLVFIPLLFLLPEYWFIVTFITFCFHISGCAGDFYVFFKLLFMPKHLLVEDYGIGILIYEWNELNERK